VKFTVSAETGFRIREAPLTGIFSYQNPGSFMREVVICDPQTVRSLNAILLATNPEYEPPEEAVDSMTDDVDSLFQDGEEESTAGQPDAAGQGSSDTQGQEGGAMGLLEGLKDDSGEAEQREEQAAQQDQPSGKAAETDGQSAWKGGSWNFIILRTEAGASAEAVQTRLNERLAGYDVRAVGWRTAAGNAALLVLLVQVLFNMGFVLVAIAGIIGIVNILLIAVFRRTREIGTLRAMGASDSYIRALILSENLLITFVAGLAGIAAGTLALQGVNSAGIAVSNQLFVSLLGQKVIDIGFSPATALTGVITALALGIIASIYPVQRAIRIDPIVAVREG
jgi:hypothetical protein